MINDISDQVNFIATPSKKANSNSLDGRPSEGNAIIWNKNLNLNINLIVLCDYYLISELSVNESKILLVNVYMPYDNRSNEIRGGYQQILCDLEASLSSLGNSNLLCVGDFNADHNRGRLWPLVNDFVTDNNFTVSDLILPVESFPF